MRIRRVLRSVLEKPCPEYTIVWFFAVISKALGVIVSVPALNVMA